jgi:hypothetical protein
MLVHDCEVGSCEGESVSFFLHAVSNILLWLASKNHICDDPLNDDCLAIVVPYPPEAQT